ncbi:GNAT family N-acetyltransferase [Frateuria hangzhouensis]|uniref:GNAT family N-acetyltransferase n=1 Tax=Frateuria hangzhouensis TaxID=2995589 RepID=UPI002260B20C|nr:GNAT family N-acetyltransferase [Frateuria sp. STR12]MCX7515254.1 GNAT family N-acetyltransferase [Frateuria sp. STR12]
MPYLCQLEPDVLLEQFLAHPPVDFATEHAPGSMPTFRAPFDLLTTADEGLRRRITALPLYRMWGRWLRWRTRFAGCTVTEYTPLPAQLPPAELARELKRRHGREGALFIVKDIAHDSPLLDGAANAHANAFASACESLGFVVLEGLPLAWVPIDFASEDDYLARRSAARRKDIRRKLKARAGLDIDLVPTGAPCFGDPECLASFYALYRAVHAQSEIHFDLLSEAFFRGVLQSADGGGVVFCYRHAGELIGWNLCYEFGGKLVDKYVGFAYPQARKHNLYVVSWMHNLAYARSRGLSHYVAGWTDPVIKGQLGARFTSTRHAVYVRNPVLRVLLRRMAHRFESEPASAAKADA